MKQSVKWTEARVLDALRGLFHIGEDNLFGERHSMLTQFPYGDRILDALVLDHETDETAAIEVKVSVADFRNETNAKRSAAEIVGTRCWYAAPAGVLTVDMLPQGWGLLVVNDLGDVDVAHPARERFWGPDREVYWDLFETALRRASVAEDKIHRGDTVPAEVARLRDEVTSLTGRLERAHQARDKQRAHARGALSMLLALDGMQECADCGSRIVPTFSAFGEIGAWRHVDGRAETTCRSDRAEANRVAREQATGARYLGGFPGPVIPKAVRDREQPDPQQEGTTS